MRAFVRTVGISSFRPHLVAASIQADLSRSDARWFLLLCMIPLYAVIAAGAYCARVSDLGWVLMGLLGGNTPFATWPGQMVYPWYRAMKFPMVPLATALAITWVLVVMPVRITAFARYPSELRERILTAAHYLAGALIGGGLAGALLGAALWMGLVASGFRADGRGIDLPLLLLMNMAVFASVAAILLWMIVCIRFWREVARVTATHAALLMLASPVMLMVALLFAGFALPWIFGLLHLIVVTLRG